MQKRYCDKCKKDCNDYFFFFQVNSGATPEKRGAEVVDDAFSSHHLDICKQCKDKFFKSIV